MIEYSQISATVIYLPTVAKTYLQSFESSVVVWESSQFSFNQPHVYYQTGNTASEQGFKKTHLNNM